MFSASRRTVACQEGKGGTAREGRNKNKAERGTHGSRVRGVLRVRRRAKDPRKLERHRGKVALETVSDFFIIFFPELSA